MFETILLRSGLLPRLRGLWKSDVDAAAKPLRKDVRQLASRIEQLEDELAETSTRARHADRIATRLELTAALNDRQRAAIAELPRLLDEQRITRHIRAAIESATLLMDPYEHAIVERLLPDDVYHLLLDAIPPAPFFHDRDPIKRDIRFPMAFGPTLTAVVWGFFDEVIARRAIRGAVLDKFHEPLQRHFDAVFGQRFREQANALPQSVSGGRLMLRSPGYHLDPHRDPKHTMLTCLLYLARPGDSETYGTQIFRVAGDTDASYKQTYYPEQEGHTCELVKVVPFRPNCMLVFLNSRGAHGATIPADAPTTLERYSYQFYIAPQREALSSLIKALPHRRRAMWRNKPDGATSGSSPVSSQEDPALSLASSARL
jgi:hypothetical protein